MAEQISAAALTECHRFSWEQNSCLLIRMTRRVTRISPLLRITEVDTYTILTSSIPPSSSSNIRWLLLYLYKSLIPFQFQTPGFSSFIHTLKMNIAYSVKILAIKKRGTVLLKKKAYDNCWSTQNLSGNPLGLKVALLFSLHFCILLFRIIFLLVCTTTMPYTFKTSKSLDPDHPSHARAFKFSSLYRHDMSTSKSKQSNG